MGVGEAGGDTEDEVNAGDFLLASGRVPMSAIMQECRVSSLETRQYSDVCQTVILPPPSLNMCLRDRISCIVSNCIASGVSACNVRIRIHICGQPSRCVCVCVCERERERERERALCVCVYTHTDT